MRSSPTSTEKTIWSGPRLKPAESAHGDIRAVGEHPVGPPELTNDLFRGVTLPAVRHDLTSLPARNREQQDDSHNDRTYKTGSATWSGRTRVS
jgi:hypothetical protein